MDGMREKLRDKLCDKLCILVTGAGSPGFYTVFNLINHWWWRHYYHYQLQYHHMRIFGCDMSDNVYGSALVPCFNVKRGDEDGYINEIESIVRRKGINLIIPLTDPELLPLASARDELNDIGCDVLVSDVEALKLVLDKYRLYERLPEISPCYERCRNISAVRRFIHEHGQCYIKLPSSYGGRGVKRVLRDDEWLNGFYTYKPEDFGYTFPISHVASLINSQNRGRGRGGDKSIDRSRDAVAVEYLPGAEYSVDCVFSSDGNLVFYGVREREVIRNGICQVARFVVDHSGEFLAIIRKISAVARMRYNVNIQLKRDAEGKLKLLEINPRISGSIGAFFTAGFNLVGMALDSYLNINSSKPASLTPTTYVCSRAYRVSFFIA